MFHNSKNKPSLRDAIDAIERNKFDKLERLIKIDPSLLTREDEWGRGILYACAKRNDQDNMAKYLLRAKVRAFTKISGPEKNFKDPIYKVISEDNLDEFKKLIKINSTGVEGKDSNGKTLLHYAAEYDSINIAKYLLQEGAKVEEDPAEYFQDAIFAVTGEDSNETKQFLEIIASLNAGIKKINSQLNTSSPRFFDESRNEFRDKSDLQAERDAAIAFRDVMKGSAEGIEEKHAEKLTAPNSTISLSYLFTCAINSGFLSESTGYAPKNILALIGQRMS